MVPFFLFMSFLLWLGLLVGWDIRTRRLPDQLTLPGAGVIAVWAVVVDPWLLIGGLGWFFLYLLTAGVVGGIGGGDIKFALGLGTVAALGGVESWMIAVAGASLVTLTVTLLATGVSRNLAGGTVLGWRVPHGPGMALATCVAVVFSFTQ